MRAEDTSVFSQFTDRTEGKDLESTTVCEDRSVPGFEFMKSAGGLEYFQARTEIKMICVSEDYLSLNILLEVSMVYTLDRTDCAHRHEYRGFDLSMISRDDSATSRGLRVIMRLNEFHSNQFNRQR